MSSVKALRDYVWRVLTEFDMIGNRHEEVMAMSTGLRDGEIDKTMGLEMARIRYSENTNLEGFYNQGYKHGRDGTNADGTIRTRYDESGSAEFYLGG